jgi:predicted dehydrogenase
MSPLRVGILGAGGIGARHAGAAAAQADQMQVVAVCGRDPEKTQGFVQAHAPKAKAFTDLRAMLDDAALDLLVVALPPFAHNGQVELAARRGVNLLVEKPIALTDAAALQMVETVEASGVTAAVGFMYRFGEAVQRWQDLSRSGETGPVGLFTGNYHCNALHNGWWPDRARSGGQMVEQLIHLVDLARVFMGEPDTVYARAANLFHRDVAGYSAEDLSSIIFGWDDGRVATFTASNIAVPGRWAKDWLVAAERMTGRFADWNNAVLTRTRGEVVDLPVSGTTDAFVAQLADVAEAIRQGRAPTAPLSDGAASLRLVLAARRSADEGREVRLTGQDASRPGKV